MKRRGSRKAQKPAWAAWVASGLVLLVGVSVSSYFLDTRGIGLLGELRGPHPEQLRLLGAALVGSALAAYLVVANALRVSPAPSRTRRLVRRALEIDFTDPDVVEEFASVPELRELVAMLVGEKSQNQELSDRLETLRGEIEGLVAAMQHSLLDRGRIRVESLSDLGAELAGLWNTLAERAQRVEVAESSEDSRTAPVVEGSLELRVARIESDLQHLKSKLEILQTTTPEHTESTMPWDSVGAATSPDHWKDEVTPSQDRSSDEPASESFAVGSSMEYEPASESFVVGSSMESEPADESFVVGSSMESEPADESFAVGSSMESEPADESFVVASSMESEPASESFVVGSSMESEPVSEGLVIEGSGHVDEGLVVDGSTAPEPEAPTAWKEPVIPEPDTSIWQAGIVELPEPKPHELARGSDLEPMVASGPETTQAHESDLEPADLEPTADRSFDGFALPQFQSQGADRATDRVEVTYEAEEGEDVEDLPASAVLFDSVEDDREQVEGLSSSGKQEYQS